MTTLFPSANESPVIRITRPENGWMVFIPENGPEQILPPTVMDNVVNMYKKVTQDPGDLDAILEKQGTNSPEQKKELLPKTKQLFIFKTYSEMLEFLKQLGIDEKFE